MCGLGEGVLRLFRLSRTAGWEGDAVGVGVRGQSPQAGEGVRGLARKGEHRQRPERAWRATARATGGLQRTLRAQGRMVKQASQAAPTPGGPEAGRAARF